MKWLKIAIIAFLLLPITSCSRAWEYEAVDYTLRLYYLDGGSEIKTITFVDGYKPRIATRRGSYWLGYSNPIDGHIDAVCRFDIISKSKPYITVYTSDGTKLTPREANEQGYLTIIEH